MRKLWPAIVLSLGIVLPAGAGAQGHGDYNIMVPETGAPPAHQSKAPRGSSVIVAPAPLSPPLHYVPPTIPSVENNPPMVPPPIVAPSGQLLPNLPSVVGAGPNGSETYQDRAVRCAHQAGVYGNATGNPSAYLGACVNQ